MQKSESIAKLAEALSKAQGQIKGALKDTDNPYFKRKYADLTSVWDACRDQLSANGLSVVQTTDDSELGVIVETFLIHSSGEWIGGRLKMKPVKDDPQGVGSAITYARRYALAAIVGVAPEDDDGNEASGVMDKKEGKPDPKPKRPEPESNQALDQHLAEKEAEEERAPILCHCGDKIPQKSIDYYMEHPNLEVLCFACSTRKKNKQPYGVNRPKDKKGAA